MSTTASAPVPSASVPSAPVPSASRQTLAELEQRVRDAGFAVLADIVAARVAQTRRKMKLTEDEARAVCEALLAELPSMPEGECRS